MSSDLRKPKQSEKNARVFQITASVNSLKLECRKNVWHPREVVILWDKKGHPKTIPWQLGANNLLLENVISPPADPVTFTCTTTLYKNPERKGTYEGQPLKFFIKNETKRGCHKVIATGSIDLAGHINKKSLEKFYITVALKAATKNVISGSISFKMSSVMLEDSIPYLTKEELVKEILQEAVEGADKKKTENIPVGSNKDRARSAKSKPLLPVNTSVAARQQKNSGVDNISAKELGIKDAKTLSSQRKNEEKKSACGEDACMPFGGKEKKRSNKGKTSKEESSPGECNDMKQLALASKGSSLTKEKAKNIFKGHETAVVKKKEKEDKKIPLLPDKDFKDSKKMKSLNREESVAVEDSGEEKSSSDNSRGSVQTVIEKQEPGKSEVEVQDCVISSDNGISNVPGSSNDKATATGTGEQTSADADAEKMENEKLTCFFNKLLKASPPKEVASKGNKIISSARDPTKASFPGRNKNKAIASVEIKDLPTTDADAEEEEKQRLASFFNKLTKPAPHKATRTLHFPQLSAYVAEEMNYLRNEIASVDKVLLKLEREIQQTMDIADCTEEYKGLTQDWLTLVEYRGEFTSRRNTLQILTKQEDFEQCCTILRDDLKVLLTLEDWKKTAFHKGQQAKLLHLIFTFVNK